MAVAIKRQIVDHGGVRRGVFGVAAQTLTPTLARAMALDPTLRGALVTAVKPDSAAASAGLQPGDLIRRINRNPIDSATRLETELALLRVGEKVTVEILRRGQQRTLTARVADPFASYVQGAEVAPGFAGALLGEVVDDSHLGTNSGIAVGPVEPDSIAARNGLTEGDVLFQVNRIRVTSLAELADAADQGISQIRLRRGNQLVTLVSR